MAEAERKIFRERRVADSFDEQDISTSSADFSRNFRPLKGGGSNFHSEQFCFQPDKITITPTKAVKVISNIVLCVGLLIIAAALIAGQFAPAIFLILFFSIFFWVFKFICTQNRAEFDLQNNSFYPCGRKPGKKYIAPIPLDHADFLYTLEKTCRGNKGRTYTCYELNISMKSGDRYNLLNHGGKSELKKDAEKLASLLNLPLEESCERNSGSAKKQKSDSIALIIVGIFFLFIGAIATYQICIAPLCGFIRCQNWEQAPAVIQKSYVHSYRGSKGKWHYRLELSYGYLYKGKQYKSNRYDYFADHIDSQSSLRKITRNYPVGKGTICYVNPENPSQAVLSKEFLPAVLFPLIFVNLFPLAGFIMLFFGIRLRKKAKTEGSGPNKGCFVIGEEGKNF